MLYNINLALNMVVGDIVLLWALNIIWLLDFGIMPRPHFGGSKVLLSHSGSIDPHASRGRNLPVVITNAL